VSEDAEANLSEMIYSTSLASSASNRFCQQRVKKVDDKQGYLDLLWKNNPPRTQKLGKDLKKAYKQAKDYATLQLTKWKLLAAAQLFEVLNIPSIPLCLQ
jgi:hypothetical protein